MNEICVEYNNKIKKISICCCIAAANNFTKKCGAICHLKKYDKTHFISSWETGNV